MGMKNKKEVVKKKSTVTKPKEEKENKRVHYK